MVLRRNAVLVWVAVFGGLGCGGAFIACGSSNGTDGGTGPDAGDATSSSSSGAGSSSGTGSSSGAGSSSGTGSSSGAGSSSGPVNIGDAGNPFGSDGGCVSLGNKCASNGTCCSGTCNQGACGFPACVSDGLACTGGSQCCSGTCTNGTCAPLNAMCKTLGNACTTNGGCCSGLCSSGTCQPSSFCGQTGDACHANSDCCVGSCTIPTGNSVGTCGTFAFGGNCSAADGQLCFQSALDGGCGGTCCSRLCAPWGPTGIDICQPATGCHVEGDTCITDDDCCGSAALKDAGVPTSGQPVVCMNGYCQQHMGCTPNGDVCKLMTMSCNANQDCCAGLGNKNTACRPDNLGVPRCADESCQDGGGACATSADCCNGNPCVPTATGNPPFVCYGSTCVACGGPCSTSADCCPGASCIQPTGGTQGTCGPCGGGSSSGGSSSGGSSGSSSGSSSGGSSGSSSSGGSSGSGSSSGGSSSGGPDAGCSLYGQVCTTSSQCCDGVPCNNGRCEALIQ